MPPQVTLVYDGADFTPPAVMGQPREDQLQGTPMDRLGEICGRVSYDSLGRGRPSREFHENLRAQRHHSVYRHATLTFAVQHHGAATPLTCFFGALLNRPGVFVTDCDGTDLSFVSNLQAALEWREKSVAYGPARELSQALGRLVRKEFRDFAPLSTPPDLAPATDGDQKFCPGLTAVSPTSDDEVYASVFLADVSRVAADELLRHAWACAPSMESTRYVDVSRRAWVPHPLLLREGSEYAWCLKQFRSLEAHARSMYNGLYHTLSAIGSQDAATTATTKTLRGAARGVVGLSVGTRLVFTASISAWKEIAKQRISPHADEEIREVVSRVIDVLAARWPDRFPKEVIMPPGA